MKRRKPTPLHVEALESRELLSGLVGFSQPQHEYRGDYHREDVQLSRRQEQPRFEFRNASYTYTTKQADSPAPITVAPTPITPSPSTPAPIEQPKFTPQAPVVVIVIITQPPAAPPVARAPSVSNSAPPPQAAPQFVSISAPTQNANRAANVVQAYWPTEDAEGETESATRTESQAGEHSTTEHVTESQTKPSPLQANWDEAVRRLAAENPDRQDMDDLIELDLQSQLRRRAKLRYTPSAQSAPSLELRRDAAPQFGPNATSQTEHEPHDSVSERIWAPEDDGLIELPAGDRLQSASHYGPAGKFELGTAGPTTTPAMEGRLGSYQAVEDAPPPPAARRDEVAAAPAE